MNDDEKPETYPLGLEISIFPKEVLYGALRKQLGSASGTGRQCLDGLVFDGKEIVGPFWFQPDNGWSHAVWEERPQ